MINRFLYITLISLLTIAGFTMYEYQDVGQVSVQFADFSFQTNFIVLGAALLCITFMLMLCIKLIESVAAIFSYFGSKRLERLRLRAHESLNKGLIEYAEGRFYQSEKLLLQQINHSDNRLLAYLSAARAAQQLGAHDRRDEYLRKAHLESPDADIAIGLTKAELQLAHDQNEQALATLSQLYKLAPGHTYVLTLLANTYRHLHDWDELDTILPDLKKSGHLSTESLLGFEIAVARGQMSRLSRNVAAAGNDPAPLLDYWRKLAHHLKALPDVIEHYVKQLVSIGAAGEAEKVLRNYLSKNWQDSTVKLYAELDVVIDNRELEIVEGWLDEHQHNAWLLLALGKRCIGRSLWGKARNYLEASIAIEPLPENYLILARLLEEHMNDMDAAQEYYRQGLHLLAGVSTLELVTDSDDAEEEATPHLKIVKS